ncbi:DUF883 family protein [Rhodobacteraceae bacterium CCMM004]|nr:DUF883 family protein [Rhodobacteraceae bacterium CCMM004]
MEFAMAQTAKFKSENAETEQVATAPSSEDLSRQIEMLKADIGKIAETLTEMGRSRGQDVADKARAQAEELQSKAEAQAAALRSTAESAVDDAERYVRANPVTALGIAAAIGLLIGLLSGRR